MNKPPLRTSALDNIQAFLDDTRGQITIGEIPPIRRAALAAEGKKARVALVCRDGETVSELLQRLDAAADRSTRGGFGSTYTTPAEKEGKKK
jgi:hypothetical protein